MTFEDATLLNGLLNDSDFMEKFMNTPIILNVANSLFHQFNPEPGERNPWTDRIWFGHGEGDDGGGAAIAAYQYGLCPTYPQQKDNT